MANVKCDTYELSQEPRYIILIRGVVVAAVALASSKTEAHRVAEPYQHLPEVEVTIKPLPLDRQDQTAASDLLDAITRTVVEIGVTDTLILSAVVTAHRQPSVEEGEQ